MSFPKISRQFFDYIPTLVDICPRDKTAITAMTAYYILHFLQNNNPHNRFFFYRLCGFALLPHNLITSLPRTSFPLSLALLSRVRGAP